MHSSVRRQNNEPRAGFSQLGTTSRAALCAEIWSAAERRHEEPFFEADLDKTDPLAYNIVKNLTEF